MIDYIRPKGAYWFALNDLLNEMTRTHPIETAQMVREMESMIFAGDKEATSSYIDMRLVPTYWLTQHA